MTLRVVVATVFLVGALRATLFTVYRVAGTSMLEALADGDRILVCDVPWLMHPAQVGDTVVFEVEGEVLVKRVLGVPGDRIAMFAGHVVRNGDFISERVPEEYDRPDFFPEHSLAPDEYFVLGDNRRVSVDSRDFGPVRESQLLGRVVLRLSDDGVSSVSALDRR